jgi:hypothetical protein
MGCKRAARRGKIDHRERGFGLSLSVSEGLTRPNEKANSDALFRFNIGTEWETVMNREDDQAALRNFRYKLTAGNHALSLRSREALALAEYVPLAQRLKSGDTTVIHDFEQKAELLLEITREIHGSQRGYFERLDEITSLIDAAIASPDGANDQERWTDNQTIIDWWKELGHTNGKTARDAFKKLPGTKGMTARFEALWKAEHPNTTRGKRNTRR